MKSFDRIFLLVSVLTVLIWIAADAAIFVFHQSENGRPYRVEAERIALEIEEKGIGQIDLSGYQYVSNVRKFGKQFDDTDSDYMVREIDGELYRFDYSYEPQINQGRIAILINMAFAAMSLLNSAVLIYLRQKMVRPFEQLTNVPYELAKGNLTIPIKENRDRFFGKFIWGINMLREHIEQQKMRELNLQREKKTLLLSLSHDIKTPLSAIKLYAKALSNGLYKDENKQLETAENINKKADEIEQYVSQIMNASRENFLSLDVNLEEFYLSGLIENITDYYSEKLAFLKIAFEVETYSDCMLKGDLDRSAEALQNIIENASKYGDGQYICISFSREENCVLISVKNSGCTLPDRELAHMFDSFWRGQNSAGVQGSGLGLYICRQLMHKMGGEVFAEIRDGEMVVTVVFVMAD